MTSLSDNYKNNLPFLNLDSASTQFLTIQSASAEYQKSIPFSSASPTDVTTGNLWFDTSGDSRILRVWDGSGWYEEGFVPTPTVSSINPNSYDGRTGTTFEIFGTNFQNGATVAFIGANGAATNASVVVRDSANKLTVSSANLSTNNEPYSIRVTNPAGNFAILPNSLDAGSNPVWSTSTGNLGIMYDIERSIKTFSVLATDPDGTSLIYSISSGQLPTGMTLDSSSGIISGTANAVANNTTYAFTVDATDGVNISSREFNISVRSPIVVDYYSTSTFTAPEQLTGITLLAVGGGGGGGNSRGNGPGGNGGGAGIVFYNFKQVAAGQSYSITIGGGGGGAGCNNQSGCPGAATSGIGVTAGRGGGGVSEFNGNCSGGTNSVGTGADVIYNGGSGGCSFGAAGGGTQYTTSVFGAPTVFGGQNASGNRGGGGGIGGSGTAGIFRIKY